MPRLAVLGHPVAHSRSPAMQNAALAALGLGEEWSYEAIDVAPEDFEARRAGDGRPKASRAPTSPSRTSSAALALADAPSEVAREIGAANTLVFAEGEIQADNTDAGGLLAALPATPLGRRGRWCWAPAAPPGRWSGRWSGEGARGRGLEPHRELRAATALRGARRQAGRRARLRPTTS